MSMDVLQVDLISCLVHGWMDGAYVLHGVLPPNLPAELSSPLAAAPLHILHLQHASFVALSYQAPREHDGFPSRHDQ